ncbi:glycoside hydrolase family 127 protein [Gracilibacillus caseinilyticus]|uniref:Glycoside hydrolase family 127 protein n=1 Tax=Gracilibacillus caseinilyticus TaxID=2932256 RepID=A0ABY4ET64_9BACI|nr:glycoside hydrolase family 127 protein [Gracilibacillus caseinilyticus]UOQ47067.1 glycoside hydrolase family 127 protein [Gracilibacillus caseinilyticus]
MQNIRLLESMFNQSQLKGKEYLLNLDVDRLIAPCYEAAGQQAKKIRYGGWEEKEIAGHSLGHWLSAAAAMYSVTEDSQLKEKIDYALTEIANVQSFDVDGYVSGFPRDCFDRVFTGDFEVGHFNLGGSWVPWYSIDKIYAGLIDVYQLLKDDRALEIVKRLADWAYNGLRYLNEEQFQRMLICEHGGMMEVFANLYVLTEEKRYLELAERFYHRAVLDPLANKQDDLEGKHANTQFPKVIGAAKLYNITGNQKYRTIAEYFWDQVVHYRTYAIGGNSIREHFGPENNEELGILTTETCNTYNMLILTELLFEWNPSAHYYDYYERALYNHILASQDPDSGMKTYFVSSQPGHFKVYHSHDHSFWCCTGTGMENPARYNRRIFERIDNRLYVHLFIPAEWNDGELIVNQQTKFPYHESTTIQMEKADEGIKEIAIRKPTWAAGDIVIKLNGRVVTPVESNGYLLIRADFRNGDQITCSLPMNLHRYYAKDDRTKQVLMYGPIILAGALGRENYPERDILEDHLALNHHPLINVPTLVTDSPLEEQVTCTDQGRLYFETDAIGYPGQQRMKLKPFYDIHHERYTIYWYVMSHALYKERGDAELKRKAKEQQIIVDEVTPHEQQPEIEHHMQAVRSSSGYNNDVHSGWRDARDGGYFSYQLKVEQDREMYLYVTYNRGDFTMEENGRSYQRHFDILLEGEVIATEHFTKPNIGALYGKRYPIPSRLLADKDYVTVTFSAKEDAIAGGVYHVRMLNEASFFS